MTLSSAHPIPATFTRAAFPLGGIGTGNVSIGSRGELRDWEVRNRPDKGGLTPFSFFAISAAAAGGERVTRILEARHTDRRDHFDGGASRLDGLPRLRSSTMRGEYPLVEVAFEDDVLPVGVVLSAFTPLIPLESDDSGIPAAVIRYRVTNPGTVPVSVTVAGSLSHVAGLRWRLPGGDNTDGEYEVRQKVAWREQGNVRGIDFGVELDPSDLRYGTMSLMTTAVDVTAIPDWSGSRDLWHQLRADGRLAPVERVPYPVPDYIAEMGEPRETEGVHIPHRRTGSLAVTHEIPPGERRDFEFVLAWHFPNRVKGWDADPLMSQRGVAPDLGTIRNHYATLWEDAWAAGAYLLTHLERLESGTRAFHDALFATTADPAVLDAVSATIVPVRSTTCFRVEGGTFFGWEGSGDHAGSCGGTCTHVWSYAQTVAWLFPDLERSARRVEFLSETEDDGRQYFRTHRWFGGEAFAWPAAVDGQLRTIVRLHREWRFSGDDAFLRELWPAAVRSLDYALREWDADGDGVLDALMHNTYDIEFDGSEPLSNVLLLAALRAAVRMATRLGDEDAASRYVAAFERSAPRIDELMYTGEYFRQRVADIDALPSQYGSGVLSDQLLGQFQAHVNGLGHLLPAEHVRSALSAVFRHNFRADLSAHESLERAYAVDEEGGLLVASWPYGGRPRRAFSYSDEVWTGIEYHVAAGLIYEGLVDEGLTVVRAARARHSGRYRSPWNDIEAGNHYARSMSAWGILLALSGAQYDGPASELAFDPVADGTYFFSTGTGWGRATIEGDTARIDLDHGILRLDRLVIRGRDHGPVDLSAGERSGSSGMSR